MITKFLNFTLLRLMGIGALLLASAAMGQGFTVNDGTARGTCTQFTFTGGVLALSPANCLGTVTPPPPPPPPTGPVFSFATGNPTSISEAYAIGVPNKALALSVHLERAGNTNPLNVDIVVCGAGTNCTAVGGQDYQLADFGLPAWTKTLAFGPTDTDQSFYVFIVDDLVSDGNKVLTFKLQNATSPAGISGATSSLTILDDEAPPSTSPVAFGLAAYRISEANPDHMAAITLTRSSAVGAASVQVEIVAAGTTAVVGTHYSYDQPATPFSGSPPTYTVSFADGQSSRDFYIPVIDNAVGDGDKVVAMSLKNPSGLTLGSPSSATLTIVDNDPFSGGGGGDLDKNGQPMAHVTIDQLVIPPPTPNNFCAYGRFPGGNIGPCGASPVDPTACGTGIAGGITNAWQLNMVDGTGALTYMPFRFHTVHMLMSKQHAMSWKFHTPPAGPLIPSPIYGGFQQSTTTLGSEASTFMSVTSTRCDFDYTKVNTLDACYRSSGGTDNAVPTRLSPPGTPADFQYCELAPDTTYYMNIRWENANGANRGIEACNPILQQCGMAFAFQ